MFLFHLIASKALRQDPVVDFTDATWERPVDHGRAPLLDSFCDSFRVDAVSEGEELPVDPSSHLRDINSTIYLKNPEDILIAPGIWYICGWWVGLIFIKIPRYTVLEGGGC